VHSARCTGPTCVALGTCGVGASCVALGVRSSFVRRAWCAGAGARCSVPGARCRCSVPAGSMFGACAWCLMRRTRPPVIPSVSEEPVRAGGARHDLPAPRTTRFLALARNDKQYGASSPRTKHEARSTAHGARSTKHGARRKKHEARSTAHEARATRTAHHLIRPERHASPTCAPSTEHCALIQDSRLSCRRTNTAHDGRTE
jgi:hypothetical protein